MNWLSFFIGVLVGWLIEWIIDLVFRNRRLRRCLESEAGLRRSLELCDARASALEGRLANREREAQRLVELEAQLRERATAAQDLAQRLAECQSQLRAQDGAMQDQVGSATEGQAQLKASGQPGTPGDQERMSEMWAAGEGDAEPAGGAVTSPAETGVAGAAPPAERGHPQPPDDLVIIEGIGPRIAQVLREAGIVTFADLAATGVPRLIAILSEAGPHFRLADPASWPEQAHLAAIGDHEALRALQARLSGGRERSA